MIVRRMSRRNSALSNSKINAQHSCATMGRLAYLNRTCGKRGGRTINVHVCILSKDAARGAEYAEPLMFDPRHKAGCGRCGSAWFRAMRYGMVGSGQVRQVWRGEASSGVVGFVLVRQVRRGSAWFGSATSGMAGFVRAGLGRLRVDRFDEVWLGR